MDESSVSGGVGAGGEPLAGGLGDCELPVDSEAERLRRTVRGTSGSSRFESVVDDIESRPGAAARIEADVAAMNERVALQSELVAAADDARESGLFTRRAGSQHRCVIRGLRRG